MPVTLNWGPLSVPANVDAPTPPLTIDASDTQVHATADLASQPVGITYNIKVQYRKTAQDPYVDVTAVGGVTQGPVTDRQGNPVPYGVRGGPFPDVGSTGRQIRAVAHVSQAMSGVSGTVETS